MANTYSLFEFTFQSISLDQPSTKQCGQSFLLKETTHGLGRISTTTLQEIHESQDTCVNTLHYALPTSFSITYMNMNPHFSHGIRHGPTLVLYKDVAYTYIIIIHPYSMIFHVYISWQM